jgi:putative ABC transport system permease protein
MRAWLQDVRYALRALKREKGATTVAVVTVALAIGSATALFSIVSAVLIRPLPYAPSSRIVQVLQIFGGEAAGRDARSETVVRELFDAWRHSGRTLEAVAAYGRRSLTLNDAGEPARLAAAAVDPEAFAVFGTRPLLGRVFVRADADRGADRAVLLGERLWRARFGGDPAIVGRSCTLDDAPYTIVGVLPEAFAFPDRAVQLWLPFVPLTPPPPAPGTRFVDGFSVIARVRSGVSLAEAEAEGTTMARQAQAALGGYVFKRDEGPSAVRLIPLRSWIAERVGPALLTLTGAVTLVLLIGAANLAHVLLARGLGRRRELGIRLAVGATPARLVRQLLTESLVLTLAGGACGVAVAFALQRALPAIAPVTIPRLDEVALDWRVLGFALLVSAALGMLAGGLPALQGSRLDIRGTIGASAAAGTGFRLQANLTRAALVSGELAVTFVLLVAAGLLLESFVRLVTIDPGYDAANVATVQLTLTASRYPGEASRSAFLERLLERASGLAGVRFAGMTRSLPLTSSRSNVGVAIEAEGAAAPGAARTSADLRVVSPGFFPAMNLRLVEGRFFADADRAGAPRVAIVNQAFARRFLAGRTLGTKIRFARFDPAEIVGVVADVRHAALTADPVPEIYAPHRQIPAGPGALTLVLRTDGDARDALASAAAIVHEIDPGLPLDTAMTMRARLAASVSEPRFYLLLVGLFAVLAVSMAVAGTYGVIAYGVSQRRREIGVRLALGATPRDIVRLVVGQAAWLMAIGVGGGAGAAWAATRLLRGFLFDVSPADPTAFVAGAALVASVALSAAWIPARRAAGLDPRDALS